MITTILGRVTCFLRNERADDGFSPGAGAAGTACFSGDAVSCAHHCTTQGRTAKRKARPVWPRAADNHLVIVLWLQKPKATWRGFATPSLVGRPGVHVPVRLYRLSYQVREDPLTHALRRAPPTHRSCIGQPAAWPAAMTRILVVGRTDARRSQVAGMLKEGAPAPDLEFATDGPACLQRIGELPRVDCVILVPDSDDLQWQELVSQIAGTRPLTAVIYIAALVDEGVAVDVMKRGAQDYCVLTKITTEGLARAVANAVQRTDMARRIEDQQYSLRTFAHVLVHDLRAPLRSVGGGIDMLIEDLPQAQRQNHAEVLEFIRGGALRMERLIMSLYGLCKAESEPRQRPVDLADLVAELEKALRADLREREAELHLVGEPPRVQADPVLLLQLLQNLVANGVKFNRAARPRVEIAGTTTTFGWRIEVADNGIGIAEEHRTRIFEPFARLHAEDEFPGSGLGLATCSRIAARHGGHLGCTSVPGEGARFILDLPRFDGEAGQRQVTQPLSARGNVADVLR
ncbi:hypothetical protein CDO87_08400 [Sagittula sp. P11]|nr:hypothetical protein CDO87_08400 [Sagittula sp. P11]